MISDANREVGKYVCSRYSCHAVSAILTEMGGMCAAHSSPLLFPIQEFVYGSYRPWFVAWEFVRPHEEQARVNHGGQTLARLAERGGLSAGEALAVVLGRSQDEPREPADAKEELMRMFKAWKTSKTPVATGVEG